MGRQHQIALARTAEEIAAVKAIFQEYADFLGVDLCFQDFGREMATFPAIYDFLLLASVGGAAAGGVGLKDLGGGVCEMKRLYVKPAHQGAGVGRALVVRVIEEARARGYRRMVLDTLPTLKTAIALYREHGFHETEKYYDNPIGGVIYMALDLAPAPAGEASSPARS